MHKSFVCLYLRFPREFSLPGDISRELFIFLFRVQLFNDVAKYSKEAENNNGKNEAANYF